MCQVHKQRHTLMVEVMGGQGSPMPKQLRVVLEAKGDQHNIMQVVIMLCPIGVLMGINERHGCSALSCKLKISDHPGDCYGSISATANTTRSNSVLVSANEQIYRLCRHYYEEQKYSLPETP